MIETFLCFRRGTCRCGSAVGTRGSRRAAVSALLPAGRTHTGTCTQRPHQHHPASPRTAPCGTRSPRSRWFYWWPRPAAPRTISGGRGAGVPFLRSEIVD